MRDYWAGPVEKMKTLVRERKTEDVVLAPFEKEITVGGGEKKSQNPSTFLQSCMDDCEGASESCATLPITGLEGGNRRRGLKHPGYKALHLCSVVTLVVAQASPWEASHLEGTGL